MYALVSDCFALPEPEAPVKMVILRLGMRKLTFFRLFSRAPRISMCSYAMLQLTAFFTSARIFASLEAVNSLSAKATGHISPSSRLALSLKPNEA